MGRKIGSSVAKWADPYEGLNPEQREVVAWEDGAVAVCATAGSGKTRCVVNRIARLVKGGVDPEKILATTFTQKAAGEMNARLESLGCPIKKNGEVGGARVGTFHSVCLEIIRDGSPWARYEIDSEDQMRNAMKDILGYRGMNWMGADLTKVLGFVGECKNDLVPPGRDAEARAPFPQNKFSEAYFLYDEERKRRGLITFDDMLFLAVQYLKEDCNARVRWGGRYEHIIVDEFQDTNLAQLELIRILAEGARSLMVVGDDDQAIYEWRGARPEYLTGFDREFKGKTLCVGTNYRSRSEIVESAARVVANNKERIVKTPVAHRAAGGSDVVMFHPCENPDAEACWVAERIKEAVISGTNWGDFACLYRTNAQSRPLEEAFISLGIPFMIVGGTDFFKRKEVADVLAYLRLAVDLKNDAAFRRAVNRPFRYIGKAALDSIEEAAKKSGKPMSECAAWSTHGLQRRQIDSIREFLHVVDVVRDLMEEGKDMPSIISWILTETKYEEWLLREEGSDTSENSRVSNLKELIRTSSRFKGPKELLEHVEFLEREKRRRNVDADHGVKPNLVTCMSIHKAKGLEFPTVFLVGAANRIMPHARSENIEEERRLFFVAMTRAMDRLYITYPQEMMIGSKLTVVEVSPFVGEAGLLPAAGAVGDGNAV